MIRRSHSGRRLRRIFAFIVFLIAAICLFSVQGYGQVRADFYVDVDSGAAPLSVQFFDLSTPQDSVIFRAWDLNGDGITDSEDKNPRFTYEVTGMYTVTLIVADSAGYDTLRRTAYVNVAPVEDDDIAVRIRVVDQWGPVAASVELWGYAGSGVPMPFAPISVRIALDQDGYATFYQAKFIPVRTQSITDLYILNAAGDVIGKTGFHYPIKDMAAQRRKDAIVVLHRDLVAYHDHPVEQPLLTGWKFPSAVRFPWLPGQPALPFVQGGDPVSGPLYQVSMLIPPASFDSSSPARARYLLSNIRPDRTPLLFLHGLGQRDASWGDDETVLSPTDFSQPEFNGKKDYVWTSIPGRVQQLDKEGEDRFDVWQYVYPPDQSWEESGYLFARDLQLLLAEYDTALSSVVAHGMGGLVLRSYMQGSARGYLSFGVPTDTAAFRGDVASAVLLAVPHAGQLRAGLAYGNSQLLPGFMDANAPALRELTPGSTSLMKLADGALPAHFRMLSIAGSRPPLHTPFPPDESLKHDDYEMSVSSAMLDRATVWNAVLAGWSSSMLRSTAADEAGNPHVNPGLLPHIALAFLSGDSAITALASQFLFLHQPDSVRFSQAEYVVPSFTTLRADIGVPLLRLTSDAGTPFHPADSWRIRLAVQGIPRLIIEAMRNEAAFAEAGMCLYPANLPLASGIHDSLRQNFTTLLPLSRTGAVHPLLQQPVVHEGFGWQLPLPTESFLADPVLSVLDDLGRRFDVQAMDGDYHMHWSRATVSDLRVTPQTALLLHRPAGLHGITRGALELTADCLTGHISFLINHAGRIAPTFRLLAPDASVITSFDANDSTILLHQDPALATLSLTIVHPMSGTWTLELDGQAALPDRCMLAVSRQGGVELNLRASASHALTGDTLLLEAHVLGSAVPAADSVQIHCVVTDSLGRSEAVLLQDDGIAPDTLAGDGVFAGLYVPHTPGTHGIDAALSATAGGCVIQRKASLALHVRTGLELLSPRGGEEWRSGDTMQVRWRGDAPEFVDIHWSSDGGGTWDPLALRYPAAGGSVPWIIPDITSTDCYVRINDADGWRADTSAAAFTVYEHPSIIVLSPAGGEQWQVFSVQDVRWQVIAVEDVQMSYSTNAGRDWIPVASGIDARARSWLWTVPVTPSDFCLIRLSSMQQPPVTGISPAVFSITPIPAITVLSPNGGERWQEGSRQFIRWQSAAVDSVDVAYTTNNGADWMPIATVPARDGSMPWDIPALESDACRLRISAAGDPSLSDVSDAVFSIIPVPRLELRAPVGGEFWEISSRETIRWESAGIERVDIDYSTDNGMLWRTVAVNQPAAQGSFVWLLPVEPTDIARIRIRDTYDSTRESISPAVFSISESLTRPTLFAPANASDASSTRPNFIWRPFFGAVSYHLQVSNDVGFGFMTFERNELSGATFTSPELAVTTTYYWRVRAKLVVGYSEWSTVWSFTTGASIFGTPTLLLPFDGALSIGANVQFTWAASDTAASWHIQVSEFPNFSRLFGEEMGLTGKTHGFSGFAPEGDYFWRVRGGNEGSTAFGQWSAVSKFSTAPSPPRHLAPLNGYPDVALSPVLQWYPMAGARVYRVQLSRSTQFTTILLDTLIHGAGMQLSGLSSFTSYYWRMTVTTSRGTSLWSEPWLFRTINIGTGSEEPPTPSAQLRLLDIWPQPASGTVHVRLDCGSGDAALQLYDVLGRCVRSHTIPGDAAGPRSMTLSLNGLPAGSYILRLTDQFGGDARLLQLR
jgi:PKD repeat protein